MKESALQYTVIGRTSVDEQAHVCFVVLNKEGVKNWVTQQVSLQDALLISVREATIDLVVWA